MGKKVIKHIEQISKPDLNIPVIEKLVKGVEDFLVRKIKINSSFLIVVAVSGGMDSVTLLDLLYYLSTKYNFKLVVAHFNHKIRPNSDEDEEFVRQLAKSYGLEFYYSSGKVKEYARKNGMSIEVAARNLRYNFFEKTSRTIKADLLATAHNSDDNIETFFINLLRGSGLTGLSGIPEIRQLVKNVRIIRPLLSFSKVDIKNYADERKLKWKEDITNTWLEYTRNKVRLELIPFLREKFNPAITDNIMRVTSFLQGADEFISQNIIDFYNIVAENAENQKVIVKIPLLNSYNKYIQGEIISYLIKKNYELEHLNFNQIESILDLKSKETGAICEVNKMITCYKDRNTLIFTKNQIPIKIEEKIDKLGKITIGNITLTLTEVPKKRIKFSPEKNEEYFDYDKLPYILTLRNWREGDSFQPLGMSGTKKVSDFLIDNKVSLFDKNFVLVLTTNTDIVWVVNYQINDKYKVTESTKRVIKATITYNKN